MVLVLCPLKFELNFLLDALRSKGWQIEKQGAVYIYKDKNIVFALSGHGKSQTGIQTMSHLYGVESVTEAVLCGGAGALHDQMNIGDVVVGTQTIEHDYKEGFGRESLPMFISTSTRFANMSHLGEVYKSGTIASGDEDIIDSKRAAQLYNQTKADVVAWEGAGFMRACKFANIPATEIRVVTDRADKDASSDFKKNLKLGMDGIANVFAMVFVT